MLINIILVLLSVLFIFIIIVVIAAIFSFIDDVLHINLSKIISNKWTKSKLYKYLKSLEDG